MKRALLLALAAGFAGCKGSAYWSDRLDAEPLYQRARALRQSPTCLKLVPLEFGDTYPVPVRDAARGHFEVLFYPVNARPSKCTLATPLFSGRFESAAPAADRCVRLAQGEVDSLGPCRPGGLSMAGTFKAEARLFQTLDRGAALYLKGEVPSPRDRRALGDFVDSFHALAEPGLLPFYYRQNPDFWEWLRQQAGRSIPKS